MGVLPLQLKAVNLTDLKLNGSETFDIGDLEQITSKPGVKTKIVINYKNQSKKVDVLSRIDTEKEIEYFNSDGILPRVLEELEANINHNNSKNFIEVLMSEDKISAILGPTNTGKTYTAIKKLYEFNNGVVGFPLSYLPEKIMITHEMNLVKKT